MTNPRLLFIDIETMAELIWSWQLYDTSAIAVERHGHLLCFAWKWQGEKTKVLGQDDFKGYKAGSVDDKALCRELWLLLDACDIVVGHNASSFDIKKINYRFMVNGMTPPSPYKLVDTKTGVKRVAKFASHKLDALGEETGIGRKMEHEGWPLWYGCYQNEKKSWKKMKAYNIQDVDLLEKWYDKLLPWISNHPNVSMYNQLSCCAKCGSRQLQHRGYSANQRNRIFVCKRCGGWGRYPVDPEMDKAFKPNTNL